jgi:hypothetical protein
MSISRTIKAELKKYFPAVKFSVTSDCYSAHVKWTNGPCQGKVCEVINKYKKGKFNSMTDSYEYTNCRHDIPQVTHIFLSRHISDDIYESKFEEYKNYYVGWENLTDINDTSVEMIGGSPKGFIRCQLFEMCL